MKWLDRNAGWLDAARMRWAPREISPFRLRAWLASPVACDGYFPVTVEGALQYEVVVRETNRLPDDVFEGCYQATHEIQVPIVDSPLYGPPIAHASVGFFSPDAAASARWRRKRPRAEHYGQVVVNTASSFTKSSNMPAATVAAVSIDFFVLGDGRLLSDLLRGVSHLGSKRAGGLGLVHAWEVAGTPEDWSILGPGRRLMRAIPVSGIARQPVASEVRECATRAPYWHASSKTLCYSPIVQLGESLC